MKIRLIDKDHPTSSDIPRSIDLSRVPIAGEMIQLLDADNPGQEMLLQVESCMHIAMMSDQALSDDDPIASCLVKVDRQQI